MRAMVLDHPAPVENSPLQLRDIPIPAPDAGEIRVRVHYCGVCHTDLHIVQGELSLPKLPVVPGHQIVGTVDAVGEGVPRFKEGDRVGIPWLHSTCGKCRYCLSGQENLCDFAKFTGWHVDGGYAEATIVSENFAYAIPESFEDEKAAPLLCAGVIGYRAYRLSNANKGSRLGLYGFGASAHLMLQFARYLGCEVYVFTRTESHRELARTLGAAWVGDADDQPPARLDSAIIFAPAGALIPKALRALRKGGTLALAGITMSAIPQMDYSLLYHERILCSVANSTRQDVREFLELAAEAQLQAEVQIFEELEQANQALAAMKASEIRGAGVLHISG